MLVRERMSTKPVTITADVPITEALRIMRQNQVRRLPVLDENGKLIGIVSEKDLLYASPSPATSLSIYEMHYMLSRLQVTELMTADPVTVTPDTLLEEAALIMADSKIGGLPVVKDGNLVGIITETDIFKVFLELLGAREKGLRLTRTNPRTHGRDGPNYHRDRTAGRQHSGSGHLLGRRSHHRNSNSQSGRCAGRPVGSCHAGAGPEDSGLP